MARPVAMLQLYYMCRSSPDDGWDCAAAHSTVYSDVRLITSYIHITLTQTQPLSHKWGENGVLQPYLPVNVSSRMSDRPTLQSCPLLKLKSRVGSLLLWKPSLIHGWLLCRIWSLISTTAWKIGLKFAPFQVLPLSSGLKSNLVVLVAHAIDLRNLMQIRLQLIELSCLKTYRQAHIQ